VSDLLLLTVDLPEITLEPGEVLVTDGTTTGSVWVLVSGSLEVRKDDITINTINTPGAAFGEVAALRNAPHSATVLAAEATRLRYAADGRALLLGNPEILALVASGLADRLDLVTGYLADLRNQYADAPGLEMVSTVLGRLTQQGTPVVRPGSARDPEPDY
jgi:CRP-like cAMP-binding protein